MAERRLPVRLIALDIDGTLVGEDLVVGERTRAAIAEARRRGIEVSLVTGRMAVTALPFARSLELSGPIVAHQGALVRAMPATGSKRLGRLLYHHRLRAPVSGEIVEWALARGLTPHLNYLERMIVGEGEARVADYRQFVGDRLTVVPDLLDRARHPVTKVVAVAPDSHSPEALDEARRLFGRRSSVTLSHPRFLEFLAPGVSKGRAVRWLARRLGIPLEACLAIGDQYNDLEMIAAVGYGVAMPTAPADVRGVARFVAPPVGEEGAAQMIEQIALSGSLPEQALHVPEALEAAQSLEAAAGERR